MKFSARSRYGMTAVINLAKKYGNGSVTLKEICEEEKMSYKFLENIMRTLVNSGLVISSKGKTGGFSLSRPPREINVKEILSVTEGSLAPVSCIEHSELCHCLNDCHALKMWNGLYSAMTGYLEAVNLESLIKTDR